MDVTQEQLMAFVVYEIRLLLAGHLGGDSASDPAVKAAAHLAYALHNQADAVLHGRPFNTQEAIGAVASVDKLLSTNFQARLSEAIGREA